MISTKTEALTAQFYEWEILGRGWLSAKEPIDLEPPFTPFFGHFIQQGPIIDDGIHHTFLSSIVSAFKKKPEKELEKQIPESSYELFPYTSSSPLVTLELRISKQAKASINEIEQLLVMLSYCTEPISFEIIGTYTSISLQLVCRETDALYIKSQVNTFLKGVSILEKDSAEQELLIESMPFVTVDFGLQEEFMRPLNQLKGSSIDPFTGLFSILEHIQEGEQVIFQVLFNGVVNHWQSSIIKSVSDAKGGAFFEDAPEMLPLAKDKVSSLLFAATVRFLVQSATLDNSFDLLRKLSFALVTNSRSQSNALTPLSDAEYSINQRLSDIVFRESHRSGMLINTKELATFIHLPDSSLISKKVFGDTKKTKAVPQIATGHKFILGQNNHNGIEIITTQNSEQRLKHTHIIGATGTGKSTLLKSMICQDIANGHGVAVLDPHGDLIEAILSCIPKGRINDVLIIDPADSEYPVGFNILKAHSDIEKEVLSSDLVAAFRKLSTSWGDQMNSVFANAILAFLESTKGGTLIDIRRFLIEKQYREIVLKTVSDPGISYYWQKEYPLLKSNSIGPILTRLDAFLRPRLIRNMVAQPQGIDFEKVMNSKKILLVKLSQGLIGSENSYLLGTFVVSKIHQAALARQAKEIRTDFFFYIDEFQHFITPSMAHILSGARKYHVGLILAHQDLQQIQKADTELLNTIISNVGTRICFRLGDNDAKKLSEGFSFFEASDLQNLGTGEAIVRVEKPENDFSLTTTMLVKGSKDYADKEDIISHSRIVYSTPKEQVELLLKESMGIETVETTDEIISKPKKPEIKKEAVVPKEQSIATETPRPINKEEVKAVVQKKEETQHRYLQSLIKKMAESKGFKATIEMPTPDSKGSVDVCIEGGGITIACEVSVTTDNNWEIHNIKKCLAAGYDIVFVCCSEKNATHSLKKKIQGTLDETLLNKILVGEPEELFVYLDSHKIQKDATESTVKGYRVKVQYDSLSLEEQKRKRESVARVVLESLRKMKNKP